LLMLDVSSNATRITYFYTLSYTTLFRSLLDELTYDYENTDRGFIMMRSHDYYYLTTKPEHSHYFKKLLETPHSNKLSQAALETLDRKSTRLNSSHVSTSYAV